MENIKITLDNNTLILSETAEINDKNYYQIVQEERNFVEKNIEFINIKLSINNKKTIFFLMENGYSFKNREDNFYIFEKKCQNVKSLRISLTEECNYKCFFCHGEGSKMSDKRKDKSREEIYSLIKKAIENNYTDITFTGGEPLIKSDDIVWYLNKLIEDNLRPYITIVTNGYFVNDTLLNTIENYVGNHREIFKFNFSMHSLKDDIYLSIVLPNSKKNKKNLLEKVKENIKKITNKNLQIKLNFVLLKGYNTTKKDIREILDFAYKNNVDYVKFLELLVTEDLIKKDMYKYYFNLNSLYEEWKDELKFKTRTPRRNEYLYKDKTIVELQQCLCMEGCAKCLINTSVFFTSELKYFPCFLKPEKSLNISSSNLMQDIKEGTEIIKEFGEKYGNDSPILIRQQEYVEEKKDFYYISKNDFKKNEIEDILAKNSYKIDVKRNFKEIYFKNSSIDIDEYFKRGYIYKLFENSETTKFEESLQEIIFSDKDNGFITKFLNKRLSYESKKISSEKIDDYISYMNKLDFKNFLHLGWNTTMYKKNRNSISVGYVESSDKKKIIFMSPNKKFEDKSIIKELNLIELKELPTKYIITN